MSSSFKLKKFCPSTKPSSDYNLKLSSSDIMEYNFLSTFYPTIFYSKP